jgi:hypothetical protein
MHYCSWKVITEPIHRYVICRGSRVVGCILRWCMSCIPVSYCRHIVWILITSSPGQRSGIRAASPSISSRAADCSGSAFRQRATPGWRSSGSLLQVDGLATSGRWDLGRRSSDIGEVGLRQKVERRPGRSSCSSTDGSGRWQGGALGGGGWIWHRASVWHV